MSETQRIIKCTDAEHETLKEILSYIRKVRDYEDDKKHKTLIGKIDIKIYNDVIEMQSINFTFKKFK